MPYRQLQAQLDAMHLQYAPYAFAFKVSLLFSGIAWLNAATVTNAVNVAVGIGTVVTAGYVGIRYRLDRWDRERRRLDFADEIERMKTLDAARHESLSAQLEEARRKALDADVELKANQERMRVSLHEIRNDLHTRTLELASANANFLDASKQLVAANERIGSLTSEVRRLQDEVHRLNQGVESVCRLEKKAEAKAEAGGEGR